MCKNCNKLGHACTLCKAEKPPVKYSVIRPPEDHKNEARQG